MAAPLATNVDAAMMWLVFMVRFSISAHSHRVTATSD